MIRKRHLSLVLLFILLFLVFNNDSVSAFPARWPFNVHEQITADALKTTPWDDRPSLSIVAIANRGQDRSPNTKKNEYHFDNCKFKESLDYIIAQRKIVVDNARNNPLESVRAFGRLLHAVQDFYAHSNWIELKASNVSLPRNPAPAPKVAEVADKIGLWKGFATGTPVAVLAATATYTPAKPNGLVSGIWHGLWSLEKDHPNCPKNTPVHGNLFLEGLNKDYESATAAKAFEKYGVNGYQVAVELAKRETLAEWQRLEAAIRAKYGQSAGKIINNLVWAADFVITGTKGTDFQVKPSSLRLQVGESFGIFNKGGNPVTVELVEWPGQREDRDRPEPLKKKIELNGTGSFIPICTEGWKPGTYVLKFDPPSQLAYTTLELTAGYVDRDDSMNLGEVFSDM